MQSSFTSQQDGQTRSQRSQLQPLKSTVHVVAVLSQSITLNVWLMEAGGVVVVPWPTVCELVTGNKVDARCLSDMVNESPSSAPNLVSDI